MDQWALGTTGRVMFAHMPAPDNNSDQIENLVRRRQSIIFRLRSRHVALNMHLNKLNLMQEPVCPLCPFPYETVNHFLFQCPELSNLRDIFLHSSPNIGNTLNRDSVQLNNTAQFYMLAMSQRAKEQARSR